MKYIVSVSGGLTSAEAWGRCLDKHGKENTIPVFADVGTVRKDGKIVSGEDEDLFRFLDDLEVLFGQKIIRLQHKKYKSIWEAFFGERYVTNSRIDTCSKLLKRQILREFYKSFPEATEVLGYSWLEMSRMTEYKKRQPMVWFPLAEKPYLTSEEIGQKFESLGVPPPRLYGLGFSHNNCGGMCFKAGLGQAYDLWVHFPDRYEYNESMQERFLSEISPHGTFLKKDKKHITMKQLRVMFENGYKPSTSQYTTCGGKCMIPEQGELL